MDKVFTTALLIIASMIMAIMLFNVAYPAIVEGGDAIANMADRADERLRSQIVIVHATAVGSEVYVWVKNVGSTRITAIERADVFFGPESGFQRIPHASAGMGGVYWEGAVVNAAEWEPTATLRITIHAGVPTVGRQFVKMIAPNGVASEYFWSQ